MKFTIILVWKYIIRLVKSGLGQVASLIDFVEKTVTKWIIIDSLFFS